MKSFLCPDCIYEVAGQCKMGQYKKTVVKNIVKALEGRWLCNPLRSEAELGDRQQTLEIGAAKAREFLTFASLISYGIMGHFAQDDYCAHPTCRFSKFSLKCKVSNLLKLLSSGNHARVQILSQIQVCDTSLLRNWSCRQIEKLCQPPF